MSEKKPRKKKPKKRKPSTMPEVRTQAPPDIVTPEHVELEFREGFGYIWPPSVEHPGRWHVRRPVPCPECKRLMLNGHTQAVINIGNVGEVAHLKCRGCDHTFKLPIVRC